jgi:3-oxoacyl-[acyl-carrier-protein] synthase III
MGVRMTNTALRRRAVSGPATRDHVTTADRPGVSGHTSVRLGAGIRAIGQYVPETVVSNADLERRLDTSDAWIREHLGIRTRHVSAPQEWSSDLGAAALTDACSQAGVRPDSIDLVICGTYTPDHMLPNTAVAIMRQLGLTGIPGIDVNSGGCPTSISALDMGATYVSAGTYRRVAVVMADVSTKLFDPTDRTVGVIFGDAAACYLLEPVDTGLGVGTAVLRSDPSHYWTAWASRDIRLDGAGQRIRSGFGDNFMVMVGREIREFVLGSIPNFLREVVSKEGVTLDEVDFYAIHQANWHLVRGVMDYLGQPHQKTLTNVERIGNTAGASVPLILRQALDAGRLHAGDLVLATAFGAGLNYGAVLIRWCGPDEFIATS